jgi:transcriptional regulator with XRE-family HTH domain
MSIDHDSVVPATESTPAVADADAGFATRELGLEIRRVRSQRGLTLSDVAAATGLSVSMLSMLERGKTGVSVGTVVAIASALGVAVSELFRAKPSVTTAMIPVAQQSEITIGSGVVRRLITQDRDRGIEMTMLQLPPGAHTGTDPIRHEGHEYLTVLEGSVTVEVEELTYEMSAGDALELDAQNLHRFANTSSALARMILVMRVPRPTGITH